MGNNRATIQEGARWLSISPASSVAHYHGAHDARNTKRNLTGHATPDGIAIQHGGKKRNNITHLLTANKPHGSKQPQHSATSVKVEHAPTIPSKQITYTPETHSHHYCQHTDHAINAEATSPYTPTRHQGGMGTVTRLHGLLPLNLRF